MTAEEIKSLLDSSRTPSRAARSAAPTLRREPLICPRGVRPQGTAIYYLLEPGTFSEMHVLDSDEIFHFYLGDPVEMLQLHPAGRSALFTLGPDLRQVNMSSSSSPPASGKARASSATARWRCSAAPSLRGLILRITAAAVTPS